VLTSSSGITTPGLQPSTNKLALENTKKPFVRPELEALARLALLIVTVWLGQTEIKPAVAARARPLNDSEGPFIDGLDV